jgi:hypothetical protein
VNDYCALNSNTVKDRTPLPVPDVVLADAAPARDWGKIDLRNAFFQTPMHPETCRRRQSGRLGVSSVDGHAAGPLQRPATHQARVNEALRHLIRVCCQVFVDDVIIYPSLLEEHERNVRLVLEATRKAGLYCSRKKTELSTLQAEFLGHILPHEGIEADPSKIGKVRNWSRPANSPGSTRLPRTRPIPRKFSPSPAHHTAVLTPLMWKGFVDVCGSWGEREEKAFETIKRIVTSLPVLCPVDQESDESIWLMTDALKVGIGAVLLQGKDWRTVHPCGFDSRQYIPAERNYPTHEQGAPGGCRGDEGVAPRLARDQVPRPHESRQAQALQVAAHAFTVRLAGRRRSRITTTTSLMSPATCKEHQSHPQCVDRCKAHASLADADHVWFHLHKRRDAGNPQHCTVGSRTMFKNCLLQTYSSA